MEQQRHELSRRDSAGQPATAKKDVCGLDLPYDKKGYKEFYRNWDVKVTFEKAVGCRGPVRQTACTKKLAIMSPRQSGQVMVPTNLELVGRTA